MVDQRALFQNGLEISLKSLPKEEQRILVVDDDPSIVRLLQEFLARLGYPCKAAGHGIEAMAAMEQVPSTIVVTDLLMPGMDGMELIALVKKQWPDTDIIVVTGYAHDFRYTDVIRAGASDFIQKPFNLDELEAKLNRIIRERNLRSLLRRLSVRDGLTDLYNRRFFEHRLEEEAERAFRQTYPLFLVMLDLDRFKEFNDCFGHRAGDELLCQLAHDLTYSTRQHVDTPFRYGGDEFTVIIPQAKTEQAGQIAERILHSYRKHKIGETSLSLGVARLKRNPHKSLREDLNRLVHQADEAMYAAKRSGGNRVVLHKSAATGAACSGPGTEIEEETYSSAGDTNSTTK